LKKIIALLLALAFALSLASCGSQSAPQSDKAVVEPQPGEWMAAFSIELGSGKTENWKIYFDVSDDGKTAPTVQLIHYIGDQTPQSVLLLRKDPSIKNNSFDFSLTEYVSSRTYNYEGNATFTSSKEADVILHIYGDDYQLTAVPTT